MLKPRFTLLTLSSLTSMSSFALDTTSSTCNILNGQKSVAVTISNSNLSSVKGICNLKLKSGINVVAPHETHYETGVETSKNQSILS